MSPIRKSMFAIAAIAAAGLAAAINLAQGSPQDTATLATTSAAAAVAARFPQIDEMMVARFILPAQSNAVFAAKAEAAAEPVFVPTENCVHEHWPYIADECLVARDGASLHKPARTIPIENRV
jgi:hypothetical protein